MKHVIAFLTALLIATLSVCAGDLPNRVDIGSRRELFVDRFLIEKMSGTHLKLHEPQLAALMIQPANGGWMVCAACPAPPRMIFSTGPSRCR
jgi:hypothetical protein